jgi:uncharacterized delta-60 repeat protein
MKEITTLIFVLTMVLNVESQGITVDNTFANNGVLILPSIGTSEINDFDIDQNGFVYTASTTAQTTGLGGYQLTVFKMSADGMVDQQFGNNGISLISIEYSGYPKDIKILESSKILICGNAYTGPTNNGPGIHIGFAVRLNSNGTIDSTFATNGVFKLENVESHFTSLNILSDQSLMLGGNIEEHGAIIKLNVNGVLDSQFGSNGVLSMSSANFNFVLWQSLLNANDELISVGYDLTNPSNTKTAFCKIDANGNFVSGFGNNGRVTIDLFNGMPNIYELVTTIKKGSNSGYHLGGYHDSCFILTIDENGSLNQNFGTSGVLIHPYPFKDFDIQQDGKILVFGNTKISDYNYGFSMVRFNSNGDFDSTFYNGEPFEMDLSPKNDYIQMGKLTDLNTFYVGGSSHQGDIAKSTIVKFNMNGTLGIDDMNMDKEIIPFVYPNPFSDRLVIRNTDALRRIELFDLNGQEILVERSGNILILKEGLSKGIYILKIEHENGQLLSMKVMKE